MNEKESRYAQKLIHRLIELSSLSVNIGFEDVDEALNDLETRESGLQVFIGGDRGIDRTDFRQMDIEEYKFYINKKIYNMPVHSTEKKANYTIQISKEGLERMKEEYEYENYVLETIQTILEQCPSSPFSDDFLIFFTDKKEESYGMNCGPVDNISKYRKPVLEEPVVKEKDEQEDKGKREKTWRGKDRRKAQYYDYPGLKEDKVPRSGKSFLSPSKMARMYYAYNIVPK